MLAAENGDDKMVRLLLGAKSCVIDVIEALGSGVKSGNVDVVRTLINARAHANYAVNYA